MAVLIRQDVPGMTADQFSRLFVPVVNQLRMYPGFIANATGMIPGGYQVTEVWETQEAHERWAREVIEPTMRRAGLNQPLPPTEYLALDQFFTR